ncbi:MAG: hypothetical protein KBF88_17260, partial [Polyangiaceae bacterium]|nr:hypothetical protein [Polyangiaceae bacterium]
MRRFVAVYFPLLRIDLVRASFLLEPGEASPLALVIARPGGTIKNERSLLGNTRIDEVSEEAHALGIRPQQTIASARAKCADLCVRVVHMETVTEALQRLAESLLCFGTIVSYETSHNLVWVDVTGCTHLHEGEGDPEHTLVRRLAELVGKLHVCRVAMADGPLVASLVARFGESSPLVIPKGGNEIALRPLPITALPLNEKAVHWLTRLGIRTVGGLQSLPPKSLHLRLGVDAGKIMALLRGDDGAPLNAYTPPLVPEEIATLEYGIEATEA